jgi:hypothetical protein
VKYIQAILAVVGLLIVGGTIGAAPANDRNRDKENEGVTLYTTLNGGDRFRCFAVNVSDKTLGMTFEVLDPGGHALSCAGPNTCNGGAGGVGTSTTNPTPEFGVLPGEAAAIDVQLPHTTAGAGYCVVAVSGTDNRDNVRVGLEGTRTFTIPAENFGLPAGTNIPVFFFRDIAGH